MAAADLSELTDWNGLAMERGQWPQAASPELCQAHDLSKLGAEFELRL